MKYESTGEVRPPRDGEWYVQEWLDRSTPCNVSQAHHNFHIECPRVIMRPVKELGPIKLTKIRQLIAWLRNESPRERTTQQSILHLFPWEVEELLKELEELVKG